MVIVEQEPGLAEASPMLFPAPQVRVICSQGLGKFGLGVLCMCLAGCGQNTSKRGSASHGDAGMIGDAGVPSMIDAAPATTGAGNADAAHPPSRPSSADAEVTAPSLQCEGQSVACHGRCIDPRLDQKNCGACDAVCEPGELCSAGRCGLVCLGGTAMCGSRCVDENVDTSNCGACGGVCGPAEVCSKGRCGVDCLDGTTQCGRACVDPLYDSGHCGDCGTVCSVGAVCDAGKCALECSGSRIECSGTCVDPRTDLANCGHCGNACPEGDVCSGGICGQTCRDSARCGNDCVDTQTDRLNCGSCSNACAGNRSCSNGSCTCESPRTLCSDSCVDTRTDTQHCGDCGAACDAYEACSNGKCDCRPGAERCDGHCVDTTISAANCGACGVPCAVGKVCTLGTCEAPSSHWPTFQHDVAHAGKNAEETGVPPLKLAWSRSFGSTDIHPVAIQDGRVFVTEGRLFDSATPLYVLNASDGSDLWNHDFGDVGTIGHPSVFNGSVYLANGRPTAGPPLLWSLDAATGLVKWSAYLMAQGEQYWAPIRVNNIIYTNGGSFGGLYGIIATDGSQKFFTSLDQEDSWSAGYFAGNIFTFVGGHFRKHDATSGAILSAVDLPTPDHKPNTAPVFGSSLAYVIAYPNLVAIDPADDSVAWTANGTFFGTPAVADGVVYAIDTGNLVARDAITGELLWSFVGDGTLHFPPVIANGYVYVASPANVYAVSIATHRSVWSDKGGGWLAIAAHRLFIAGMGSKLTVYVLGHSVPCGTLDCITPPGSTRAPCCLDPFEAKCGVVSEVTRACTGAP